METCCLGGVSLGDRSARGSGALGAPESKIFSFHFDLSLDTALPSTGPQVPPPGDSSPTQRPGNARLPALRGAGAGGVRGSSRGAGSPDGWAHCPADPGATATAAQGCSGAHRAGPGGQGEAGQPAPESLAFAAAAAPVLPWALPVIPAAGRGLVAMVPEAKPKQDQDAHVRCTAS